MSSKDYSKYGSNLSFIDMLFALLIGVFSIFIISTMLLGDPKAGKKIDENSQIMITMTWDDQSADDMDLWLMDPQKDKIGYNHRENSFVSLDRDDRGVENDFIIVDGQKKEIRHNEEIVRIRKRQPGHYVVNVMFYSRHEDPETKTSSVGPQQVTVVLTQVNPTYKVLFKRVVEIEQPGIQKTIVSFDIDTDSEIGDFTTEEIPFLQDSQASGGYSRMEHIQPTPYTGATR